MKLIRAATAFMMLIAPGVASAQECILSFERRLHPDFQKLSELVKNRPDLHLVQEAVPTDLLKCIEDGAETITIVGHAAQDPSTKSVSLAYFRELTGERRTQAIQTSIEGLSREVQALRPKAQCNEREIPCRRLQMRLASQRKKLEQYKTLTAEQFLYELKPIHPQIFRAARATANEASQKKIRLKKIRWMSCMPDEALAHYPDLLAFIQEQGIELEIAPKSPILSLILGKVVTRYDARWIAGTGSPLAN